MINDNESKPKLTLEQKIEQQEQKLKQLKAQKQAIEARERTKQKEQERKDDTRRKILLGSFLKQQMDCDPSYSKEILDELNDYLSEERDRNLFDLPKKS